MKIFISFFLSIIFSMSIPMFMYSQKVLDSNQIWDLFYTKKRESSDNLEKIRQFYKTNNLHIDSLENKEASILNLAIQLNKKETCEFLLKSLQANPNLVPPEGNSPLVDALKESKKHLAIVNLLLEHGASLAISRHENNNTIFEKIFTDIYQNNQDILIDHKSHKNMSVEYMNLSAAMSALLSTKNKKPMFNYLSSASKIVLKNETKNIYFHQNLKQIEYALKQAKEINLTDPKHNDLFKAVISNDLNEVEKISNQQPNLILKQDSAGDTALHWATRLQNFKIAKVLVTTNKKILEIKNLQNYTPFSYLIEQPYKTNNFLELLFSPSNEPELDNKTLRPFIYLFKAPITLDVQLLKKIAPKNIESLSNREKAFFEETFLPLLSDLYKTDKKLYLETLKIFTQFIKDQNIKLPSTFFKKFIDSLNPHFEEILELLPDQKTKNEVLKAAMSHIRSNLKPETETKDEKDRKEEFSYYKKIVRYMIEQGADFTYPVPRRKNILYILIYYLDKGIDEEIVEIFKALFNNNLNQKFTIEGQQTSLLHQFINYITTIDQQRNKFFKTRLNLVKRINIIKLLIDQGMPTNIKDHRDHTPLLYCLQSPKLSEITKILLEKEEDISQSIDLKGFTTTPLHFLVQNVQFAPDRRTKKLALENIKIMLEKGADPLKPDSKGKSPLFYAIDRGGNLELIMLFLHAIKDKNAIIKINDNYHVTPLQLALDYLLSCPAQQAPTWSKIISEMINQGADASKEITVNKKKMSLKSWIAQSYSSLHNDLSPAKHVLFDAIFEKTGISPELIKRVSAQRTVAIDIEEKELSTLQNSLHALKIKLSDLSSLLSSIGISVEIETTPAGVRVTVKPQEIISALKTPINLGSIIETYLQEKDYRQEAKNQFKSDPTIKNPIREDMTKKWSRNAASRVFHDNLRSFLEIVVNACDAMLPADQSTGKFGMGFFSILSFLSLAQTGGTTMEIKTCYRTKENQLHAYKMLFNKGTKGAPSVNFQPLTPDNMGNKTGTHIILRPIARPFDQETIANIYHYLHYLDFYKKVQINTVVSDGSTIKKEVIGDEQATPQFEIDVKLAPSALEVIDHGNGISLEIAMTKLLVPSSSTKGAIQNYTEESKKAFQSISMARLGNFKGKKEKNVSHFIMEVNDVIVLNIPIQEIINDKNGDLKDVVVSMPQLTKLTLARNEIDIGPSHKAEKNKFDFNEERYIKEIIKKTIKHTLIENIAEQFLLTYKPDYNLVNALFRGLEAWEKQTANQYIQGLFTNYFKKQLSKLLQKYKNIVACPAKYFYQLKDVIGIDTQINLVPLDPTLVHHNYASLEAELNIILKKKIASLQDSPEKEIMQLGANGKLIAGMKTYFIDPNLLPRTKFGTPLISKLGLRTSIFLPRDIINVAKGGKDQSIKETAVNIIERFPEQEFVPYDEKTTGGLITFVSNIPEEKKKQLDVLGKKPVKIFTAHNLFETVNQTFKLFEKKDIAILKQFFDKYYGLFSEGLMHRVFQHPRTSPKVRWIWGGLNTNTIFLRHFIIDSTMLDQKNFQLKLEDSNNYILYEHTEHTYAQQLIAREQIGSLFYFDKSANKLYSKETTTDAEFKKISYIPKTKTELSQLLSNVKSFYTSKPNKNFTKSEFVNFFFGSLLLNHGVDGAQSNSILVTSNKTVWPLPKNQVTLDNLENLLFTLLYESHSDALRRFTQSVDVQTPIKKLLAPEISSMNITIPGIKGSQQFILLTQAFSDDLAWAKSIESTNRFILPETKTTKSVRKILDWYVAKSQSAPLLSPAQEKLFNHLKNALMGMYNKYFTINDSEIAQIYGKAAPSITEIKPQKDFKSMQTALDVLYDIKHDESLFSKLIAFIITDFQFQTDLKLRAADLRNQYFYAPNIMANTPISLLSRLKENGVAPSIIQTLVEHTRSPEELSFICYILLQTSILPIIKFNPADTTKKQRVLSSLQLVIDRYIKEKIDPERIKKLYRSNRTLIKELDDGYRIIGAWHKKTYTFENRLEYIMQQDIGFQLVTNYLASLKDEKQTAFPKRSYFINKQIDEKIKSKKEPAFGLKTLLKAHVDGQGLTTDLDRYNLDGIKKIISTSKAKIDIGKITQDIEAGSEKNPIEGSLIEALQNSVDAIKFFFKDKLNSASMTERKKFSSEEEVLNTLSSVKYELEYMQDKNKDSMQVCLTMRDFIGFPSLKVLLTDFILPDYSNKSPDQGNIGDMGNGSFKMYQHADRVSVLTRTIERPDKMYVLHITPQRNTVTKLVEDLELKCIEVANEVPKSFFGTSIRILFQSQEQTKALMDLLYAKDLIKSTLGITNIEVTPKHALKLYIEPETKPVNKARVEQEDIIYQTKQTKGYRFRLRKHPVQLAQSVVSTAGIPFRSFSSLSKQMQLIPEKLSQELNSDLIMDIGLGMYEPVQSRTQLQMNATQLKQIRTDLLDGLYLHLIQKNSKINNKNFFEYYFTHLGSKVADISQLHLDKNRAHIFQQNLKSFLLNKNNNWNISLKEFLEYYRPTWNDTQSYFDLIEVNIKKLYEQKLKPLNQEYDKKIQDIFNSLKATIKNTQEDERASKKQTALNHFYGKLYNLDTEFKQKSKEKVTQWQQSLLKNAPQEQKLFLMSAITPWFKKKYVTMQLHEPDLLSLERKAETQTSQEKQKVKNIDNQWQQIVQQTNDEQKKLISNIGPAIKDMVFIYCKEYLIGTSSPAGRVKKVHFIHDKNDTAEAFYKSMDASITFNLNSPGLNIMDFVYIAAILLTKKDINEIIKDHMVVKYFIAAPGNYPTLIHELEHARRASVHTGAAHPDIIIDGYNNDEPVQFNVAANYYANLARKAQALRKWVDSFKQQMKGKFKGKYQQFVDLLSKLTNIQEIYSFERDYKKLFVLELNLIEVGREPTS